MNPVAVVTGAGSGIGRALALACGQRGMTVVVADVEEPAVQQLQALGVSCHAQVCDVAQASQVQALADASWAACGRVDWLFNNAGVAVLGPVWQATADDWAWVLGVNLMGVVHGVQAFVPRMLATGIADAARNRPAPWARTVETAPAYVQRVRRGMADSAFTATEVAAATLRAIDRGLFYVMPHAQTWPSVERRLHTIGEDHRRGLAAGGEHDGP